MPAFLITIDTEGDNIWSSPGGTPDTRNAAYLPRFQALCERYGFKPTYLVNYEMVKSPEFVEFGRDLVRRNAAEIGMHLHAWNSPPHATLDGASLSTTPYLIEYPEAIIRQKVTVMTRLLEDTFQTTMISHRAGRWAFNEVYARILDELGYRVDCSVTPRIDWRIVKGLPEGAGGTDYRTFPAEAYFLDLNDISRAGRSSLLEVPMTIVDTAPTRLGNVVDALPINLAKRAARRVWPIEWLRPNGRNLKSMLRLIDHAISTNRSYVEFMLHSSEFMPGGSPTFPTEASIERLYEHLEELFVRGKRVCFAQTLAEYRATVAE